jgi:uncharacterized membrane protein YgcG
MRLVASIAIHLSGSLITRQPTLLEKMKKALGGSVDLSTERVRVELEATAIVDSVRRALTRLGVTNALSLVIDDTVVFQDTEGRADDLPDLVIALSEHASLFGRGFRELRFAAENEEAGLHYIIETRARTEHAANEPAAIVSVGGRLRTLEPRPGESAEEYQKRVEPLIKDTVAFEAARLQFESFVARLENVLREALPEARVQQIRSEARLVRPGAKEVTERPPERSPIHPAYDPFPYYYPSPIGMMLDVMILSSLMHGFAPSPAIMVVDPGGASLGSVQDVAADPERLQAQYSDMDHDHSGDGASVNDGGGFDSGGGLDDAGGFDDGGGFDSGGGGFDSGD